MLTVTGRAKARLVEALKQHTVDPDKAIRLVLAPSLSTPLGFILDEQEDGDLVVRAEDGSSALDADIEILKQAWQRTFDWR